MNCGVGSLAHDSNDYLSAVTSGERGTCLAANPQVPAMVMFIFALRLVDFLTYAQFPEASRKLRFHFLANAFCTCDWDLVLWACASEVLTAS